MYRTPPRLPCSDSGLVFLYFFLFFMASTAFCFFISGERAKIPVPEPAYLDAHEAIYIHLRSQSKETRRMGEERGNDILGLLLLNAGGGSRGEKNYSEAPEAGGTGGAPARVLLVDDAIANFHEEGKVSHWVIGPEVKARRRKRCSGKPSATHGDWVFLYLLLTFKKPPTFPRMVCLPRVEAEIRPHVPSLFLVVTSPERSSPSQCKISITLSHEQALATRSITDVN